MNRTHHRFATAPHRHAHHLAADVIEWEELPSLTCILRRGHLAAPLRHVWLSRTDGAGASGCRRAGTVRRTIDGMHVREIEGDSLFSHSFSESPADH